jgi:hypothetical protein
MSLFVLYRLEEVRGQLNVLYNVAQRISTPKSRHTSRRPRQPCWRNIATAHEFVMPCFLSSRARRSKGSVRDLADGFEEGIQLQSPPNVLTEES